MSVSWHSPHLVAEHVDWRWLIGLPFSCCFKCCVAASYLTEELLQRKQSLKSPSSLQGQELDQWDSWPGCDVTTFNPTRYLHRWKTNPIDTDSKQTWNEGLHYVLMWSPLSYTVLPKQNGRVAIVTGGTRGMGFETARHLASLGMHVVIGRLLSNYMPSAIFTNFPTSHFLL